MVNGQKTGECGRKYLVSKQIAEKVRSVGGVVQKLNGPVTLEQNAIDRVHFTDPINRVLL